MTASNRELIRRALINVKLREVAEMDRIAVSEKNISEDSLTRLRVQVMMRIKSAKPKISSKVFFIAAIIAALLLVSCSVSGFIIHRVDNGRGTDFYTNGDGMKESFEEFYIIDAPQGFTYDYVYNLSTAQSYVLSNENKEIIFGQYLAENQSIKLNTEYNGYTKEKIGGNDVIYTVNRGFYTGIWLYDGYSFALTVKGGLGYEDFVSIIESIHIALPGEIEAIRAEGETEYSAYFE